MFTAGRHVTYTKLVSTCSHSLIIFKQQPIRDHPSVACSTLFTVWQRAEIKSAHADSPTVDISGTEARYGPSMNCGGLSLMSWTLMMNSDGGSKGSSVSALITWAVSVYSAFSSRSSLFMAWMSPVISLMAKMVPAPSPAKTYLMFLLPTSKSVCSCNRRGRKIAVEVQMCSKVISLMFRERVF